MNDHREGLPDGGMDPDVGLITDYLAEALAPAARREVEQRLETDDAFRDKAIPLAALWHLHDDIPGETIDEVLDAFEAAAAARASQTALTAPAPKLIPATPPALTATRRWWVWVSGGVRVLVVTAARLVGRLGFGFVALAFAVYNYNVHHRPAPNPALAPAASATTPAGGAPGKAPTPKRRPALHIAPGTPRIVVPLDSAARSVEPGAGLRVLLPPGSLFAFIPIGDSSTYNAWYDLGERGGDVSIEVAEPIVTVNVITSAGHVTLKRGRYALHDAGGDTVETQFTVIAGTAAAFGMGNIVPRGVVAGERAVIHRREIPSIVTVPKPAARPPQP